MRTILVVMAMLVCGFALNGCDAPTPTGPDLTINVNVGDSNQDPDIDNSYNTTPKKEQEVM